MAKFFPVIGELYTCVESSALAVAGTIATIAGDDEAAEKLFDAAGNAWVEYADTNMIAAPVTMISVLMRNEVIKLLKNTKALGGIQLMEHL